MLIPLFEKLVKKYQDVFLRQILTKLIKEVVRTEKKIPLQVKNHTKTPDDLHILKFNRIDGIQNAYEEVLAKAIDTGEEILAYESSTDAKVIGNNFFYSHIKRRVKHKVVAKVICPDSSHDRKYKAENHGKYTKIKLDSDLSLKTNINIVGDMVLTFTVDPPEGTLRIHDNDAKTQKYFF